MIDKLLNLKAGKFLILLILVIALINFIKSGDKELLKTFENITLLVVGFYFGSKTSDKIIDSNLEEENQLLKEDIDTLLEEYDPITQPIIKEEKTDIDILEESTKNIKKTLDKLS